MTTFELYRRSTIWMCLTETLDEMVSNGTLTLETQVKSKVTIKGHLHTFFRVSHVRLVCKKNKQEDYLRFYSFILQDALFKNEDCQENIGKVKIVACDSKLLTQ
ncbi:hypothetical protein MKX01_001179 [Papaver californicum]|nr:hypothetical protein MKX01_001179 [Papaver californicum]